MNNKLIGDSYEIFIRDHIKNEYDNAWLWNDLPERHLVELGIIRDYDIFSRYRYDLGIDVVAVKDNNFFSFNVKILKIQ
jgi:hypothetical protein